MQFLYHRHQQFQLLLVQKWPQHDLSLCRLPKYTALPSTDYSSMLIIKIHIGPQQVWLSWLGVMPFTEGLTSIPGQGMCQGFGLVHQQGECRQQLIAVSLFLSLIYIYFLRSILRQARTLPTHRLTASPDLFVLLSLSLLIKTSACTEMLRWSLGQESTSSQAAST